MLEELRPAAAVAVEMWHDLPEQVRDMGMQTTVVAPADPHSPLTSLSARNRNGFVSIAVGTPAPRAYSVIDGRQRVAMLRSASWRP